ncbi:hypothetical protein D1606_00950 [Rummeliibacillus sp. POC4]|nr:hypothetical protein D1606_00950 [Rummeliibacillus sp. POC4]
MRWLGIVFFAADDGSILGLLWGVCLRGEFARGLKLYASWIQFLFAWIGTRIAWIKPGFPWIGDDGLLLITQGHWARLGCFG